MICNDYNGNRCFKQNDMEKMQNGTIGHLVKLRLNLLNLGIEINTSDICKPRNSDLILVENLHFPFSVLNEFKSYGKPMILVCSESEAVLKENSNLKWLNLFDSVFSYNDKLVSNPNLKNIKKFYYTFNFPKQVPRDNFRNKKSLCLISANKRSKHSSELYSKRVEVVRWYEKNYPDNFDLYGIGWQNPKKVMASWFRRKLLHHGPWSKFFAPPFRSYKGVVESKIKTLRNYKFSICFENVKDIPGYITEKIFDSMFAGCIPIYLGAKNIQDYIPEECFIDYRRFSSIAHMHEYLTNMELNRYNKYLDSIDSFIKSKISVPFRHETFVNSMTNEIQKYLKL